MKYHSTVEKMLFEICQWHQILSTTLVISTKIISATEHCDWRHQYFIASSKKWRCLRIFSVYLIHSEKQKLEHLKNELTQRSWEMVNGIKRTRCKVKRRKLIHPNESRGVSGIPQLFRMFWKKNRRLTAIVNRTFKSIIITGILLQIPN